MLTSDLLAFATVRAVVPFLTIFARLATRALAALLTCIAIPVPAIASIVVAVPVPPLAVLGNGGVGTLALLLAAADRLALVAIIVVAIEIEIVARLASLLLILEPAALVGEHAEIMVRELKIIFGIDAIALALRVRGKILVFLEKLGGVATSAAVDPIAVVTPSLATLALAITTTTAATAAPAAVLPIIDQATVLVLRTKTGLAPASRCKPSGIAAWRKADRREAATAAGLQRYHDEGCGHPPVFNVLCREKCVPRRPQ